MFAIPFVSAFLRRPGRRLRKPVRYIPVVQGLEDRCLLSTFHEYPVPDNGHGVNLNGITAGPDGNVWFTNARLGGPVGEIESITPAGAITAFPQANTAPDAIVTGADGNLWYGGRFPGSLTNGVIGRVTTDGTATEFLLPRLGGQEFGVIVEVVALGPDGNVWYGQSEYSPHGAAVGHIAPDGQATSSLVVRDGGFAASGIASITAGPDGNIWFIPEFVDGHYYAARVTLDGQYTFFETPGVDNGLVSITAGPDGNLWAAAWQFDHRTGQFLSTSIDRITVDGQFTEFALPDAGHRAASITLGPDGNLWFTEPNVNQIGMMTPDGQLTEYAIPTADSNSQQITAGPDGNIWFTEAGSGQIGEFVLNDGGGAGGAARSVPTAKGLRATNAAAVDAVFAGAMAQGVADSVGSQQPSAVAVEAALATSSPEALPVSAAARAVTVADVVPHVANGSRATTTVSLEIADPGPTGLGEIV
jgi:virginiamycin B lyase